MIKQNILFVLSLYFNYLKIFKKKHKMTIVNIFFYIVLILLNLITLKLIFYLSKGIIFMIYLMKENCIQNQYLI